ASPFDAGTAYAAIDRHRLDDFAPYIYVTHDYGKHWNRGDRGIDSLAYVQVVRSDLTRKGLLYAGTETGVYVSFDDGGHWQSLQLNLPAASVRDLAVHDNDLVAATHGRAFWVLDNLTPLQQLDESVLREDAHLFLPERAVRIRRSENRDTPLPPEEPLGTNPPSGAIIDYYLRNKPRTPISLEIVDEAGNLVRKFQSTDEPDPSTGPQYFMDAWLPKTRPLSTERGHNRFVWDLRYTSPPTKQRDYSMAAIVGQGTENQPQGPLVLPGKYRLTLNVGGKQYVQTLTVEMDPRVSLPVSSLKGQLSLAVDVWNAQSDQFALREAADSLHSQLAAVANNPGTDPKYRQAALSLIKNTTALNDSLSDNGLSGLETTIMSADREPTQQMREAFEFLNARLSNSKNLWETIKKDLTESAFSGIKVPVVPMRHIDFVR
ncbi:MAG TPA: glycoside hydrolase, partial [Bacteroidota bacterium]